MTETDMHNDITMADLWESVFNSLADWTFVAWLVFDLALAVLLWQRGHRLLEWLKGRPMMEKVCAAIVLLGALFAFGCIPQQHFGFWFALPVATFLGSSMVLFWAVVQRIRSHGGVGEGGASLPESYRRQRNLTLLAKTMLWIWSCGWVVFFLAIGVVANARHVGAEVLLRSAIASLNLFLMNIDSNILDAIPRLDILKGMIACAGFAAVLCTALLIMSLVLSRLMAYLHIRHIRIDGRKNHLYVFFGLNDASKLLADDVHGKDPQAVIVFVENSLADDGGQEGDRADGWQNIVSMMTHRRRTFADADEGERRALAIASSAVCAIGDNVPDVWGAVGLDSVKRLLAKLSKTADAELHIFFLSDDCEANVRSSVAMAKDRLVGSPAFKSTIYCRAPRNGVNRIVEDLGLEESRRTDIKLIDSAHLAMEQLKCDVKNHPVSFVQVEGIDAPNPGTVATPFTCMVVGFGETGQEAVKFLYEYGAFADRDADPLDSRRSPFCCHILDEGMARMEGRFIAGIPAANCRRVAEDGTVAPAAADRHYPYNDQVWLNFYAYDHRSPHFYTQVLDPIAASLNYVVVAMGDAERNMAAAIEILGYVRRKRPSLDHFRIYVQACGKGAFARLGDVARHYNERLKRRAADPAGDTLVLFGQNRNIFTYELVVKDQFQEDGRTYYESYRSMQIAPANDEGSWQERHSRNMRENGRTTKWERMSKIRRKESQDRSNALHALTKTAIIDRCLGPDAAPAFARKALAGRQGSQAGITYPQLSPQENRLMLNLAMCEHLRWNAAHEMMGYTDNTTQHQCDEQTKRHNCLKPWQNLDHESDNAGYAVDFKLFDYGVVETTLKMKYSK